MNKNVENEASLESLEPIRQTIRRVCVEDQFTWEQSWKSVLCDVSQARRGMLLPDVFQQTLELNNVVLTKKAFQLVVDQFQQPNGAVHALKFLQWIDLSRPVDHVDPELAFARLPQPYRRIMKVLERDILDGAWDMIRTSSAKYKAETSAALSARSAGSSVLLSHPQDDVGADPALQDDFAVAKKRCCKTFNEISSPSLSVNSIVDMKTHWRWPFAVFVWRSSLESEQTGLMLQFVDTTRNMTMTSVPVETPTFAEGKELVFVRSSDLHGVRGADNESETRFVIGLHIQEQVAAATTEPTALASPSVREYVLVYEFKTLLATTSGSACLLASLAFAESSETVTGLALSLDLSRLAVSTSKNETSVYMLPNAPVQDPTETPPSLETKLSTDLTPSALYFLQPPVIDTPHPPTNATVSPPYAVGIVAGKTLYKFSISSENDSSPTVSWPHLHSITTSSIDSSSQFITIGLADGLIVVWNLIEHRAHVMLSPPARLVGSSVSTALMYGNQFVVALFLASQRLVFYDLTNRAAPSVLRVVTPPQPSNSIKAQEAEPVRLCSLSSRTPWLDIPVAIVEYSSGYAMLYDVRNGEAMVSVRVPKASTIHSHGVPSIANLVVLTPSPVVFNWRDLLTTAFRSLTKVLEEKQLDFSVENAKRVFLSSVDVPNGPFANGLKISVGATRTLESVLLATAGLSRIPHPFNLHDQLAGSKSSSSLSSHSDSRVSLTSTPGGSKANLRQDQEPLPPLLEPATQPYKPNFAALYQRSYEEDLSSDPVAQMAKLNKRRNELLKILTAAW